MTILVTMLNSVSSWAETSGHIVLTGVVKSFDEKTVTVETQKRSVKIPRSSIQTPTFTTGDAIFYVLSAAELNKHFFGEGQTGKT